MDELGGISIIVATSVHTPDDTRLWKKLVPSLANAGASVTYCFAGQVPEDAANADSRIRFVVVDPAPASGRWSRLFGTGLAVVRAVRRTRHDVVIIPDPELLLLAVVLRASSRIVYDMHEDTAYALRHRTWLSRWMRRLASLSWDSIERILLRNRPVIVAEPSYLIRRKWLRRSCVVRNFPSASLASGSIAPPMSTPVVAYLGVISTARGGHLFVPLAERLGTEASVVIIGECRDAALRQELIEASAAGTLTWLGRMPPENAWEAIASSQVGLALLADEPNYRNSYPTKFLEYAALGLRVVGSRLPASMELMSALPCGRLVTGLTIDALHSAVKAELEAAVNWRESSEFRRLRAEIVARWSWEAERERLVALVGQIVMTSDRIASGEPLA